jgi:RND family efflux transporter MFP subunit
VIDTEALRRWLRRYAPALVPLAALAVAVPAMIATRPDEPAAGPPPATPEAASPPAPTEVAAVEPMPVEEPPAQGAESGRPGASAKPAGAGSEAFDCLIEPSELVDIGSPVIGLIDKIYVERADLVREGEVVAELESGAERAAVDLARARAAMNGTELAREANVRLGRARENRARHLSQSNVLSQDLREEAETSAELARFELQQAREDRRTAALQLAQAEELLARRTIRSPISGVVVDRLMSPGERVDEEAILRIARISPLRVEVTLPATSFGFVKPGMKAAVEPEISGDQVYIASVQLVDRVIDAASGTFGVRLELPNPQQDIPSGLHCRVRFLEP